MALAQDARRQDPDRSLCALFMPPARRDEVFGLLLLNQELARVPDLASEPLAAQIRFRWWHDAIAETAARGTFPHPALQALAPALADARLKVDDLDPLFEARTQDLDGLQPTDLGVLDRYVADTAGTVQTATLAILGHREPHLVHAAQEAGTAFGLVGIVRAVAYEAQRQRVRLPKDTIGREGVSTSEILAVRMSEGLGRAVRAMLDRADSKLEEARRAAVTPPRTALPALLPGHLAALYAAMIRRAGCDPFVAAQIGRPASTPLRLMADMVLRRF